MEKGYMLRTVNDALNYELQMLVKLECELNEMYAHFNVTEEQLQNNDYVSDVKNKYTVRFFSDKKHQIEMCKNDINGLNEMKDELEEIRNVKSRSIDKIKSELLEAERKIQDICMFHDIWFKDGKIDFVSFFRDSNVQESVKEQLSIELNKVEKIRLDICN